MRVGAFADIHGNFDAMRRAIERHPDVPFWLCVGDVASRAGAYPETVRTPVLDQRQQRGLRSHRGLGGRRDPVPNLHFIPNGTATRVGALVALQTTFKVANFVRDAQVR